MLIISSGMPKSGSTYLFHLLNGLVVAAGYPNSMESRKRHTADAWLGRPNNFVDRLSGIPLAKLWLISLKEGRFIVKTHDRLAKSAQLLTRGGGARVVYTYRDPRDCLLSALDYGAKLRERGAADSYFGRMHTFDDAFPQVKGWIATYNAYRAMPGILTLRYEDMLARPEEAIQRCATYLRLKVDESARKEILWACSSDNPDRTIRMPVNKATSYRYRTEMPADQQQRFVDDYRETILQMGFSLE
ncbi:MAG TPA: sulfotransferase domain-containing protein [Chthoniobacteraceae bacterium]|jgi:hypothetical protein